MTLQTDIRRSKAVQSVFQLLDYKPLPEQDPIIWSNKRFNLVSGGGQSGKSYTAAKYALRKEIERDDSKGPARYWLVAADYERTRREFDYLVADFRKLGRVKEVSKRLDPGHLELTDGTRYETKSGRDHTALSMYSPDGIIACEASQLDLITYWKLEERVAASGGWIFMSGTMEGSLGWYPALVPAWELGIGEEQSFILDSRDNRYLYPGGYSDPKILRMRDKMPEDVFSERIMGVPKPPQGRVFKEFQPAYHVKEWDYVEGIPVHVWIDVGYGHAHALEAAQIRDGNVHVFDEIYERGLITDDIINIAITKPWWKDVTVAGAIDIAGTQHQGMASPTETWLAKTGVYLQNQYVKINEGTERFKTFLKPDPITQQAKITFHPRCTGVLSELGYCLDPFDEQKRVYSWKVDKEGNVIGQTPDDKWNDGIKAVIYGLVAEFGYVTYTGREVIKIRRW